MKTKIFIALLAAILLAGCSLSGEHYVKKSEFEEILRVTLQKSEMRDLFNRMGDSTMDVDRFKQLVRDEIDSEDTRLIIMQMLSQFTGASKIRAFTDTIGGGTGSMDKINATSLTTNDLAFTYDVGNEIVMFYKYNSSGTTAENDPWVIRPDDQVAQGDASSYPGNWTLMTGFTFGRSAEPAVNLRDSGATDFDINARVRANCDAGDCSSGSEDVDMYLEAQVGGSASPTTWLHFDCDDSGNCDVDALPQGTGGFQIGGNQITDASGNLVASAIWLPGGFLPDGTQCADASAVQINSGPYQYTIVCADNDASTIYGSVTMPDSWVVSADVTFELAYIQTAADTNALNGDIAIQCRGPGETVNNTWGSEIAMDDAALTGSNAVDHVTSAAVDTNSGSGADDCSSGDTLYWRWQMDATGTTTAVATLHFIGMKMEYTTNVGD